MAESVRETLERSMEALEARAAPPAPQPATERAPNVGREAVRTEGTTGPERAVRPAGTVDQERADNSAGTETKERAVKPEGAGKRELAEALEGTETLEREAAPGDRPRDQFGRFLAKTRNVLEPKGSDEPIADQAPPTETEPAEETPPEGDSEGEAILPPPAWSAASKAEFAKLPRPIQNEIVRRENDVNTAFTQRAQQFNAVQPLVQAVAPYADKFALRGQHPAVAVQQLLAVQDLLERDPMQGVAHVARAYNVDLRNFAAAYSQVQKPQDPQVQALANEVAQMKNERAQQQRYVEQQEMSRITGEVEAFSADKGTHPYFDAVRPAMAQLMAQGICNDLQAAYDHACWAIPEVRERILNDQKRAEATARQKAERDAAERARRAGVSVRSTPGAIVNGSQRGPDPSKLRELIEWNWDRAASR